VSHGLFAPLFNALQSPFGKRLKSLGCARRRVAISSQICEGIAIFQCETVRVFNKLDVACILLHDRLEDKESNQDGQYAGGSS
jgi:hypothetical protein